ncbi:MAG: phospholipid carrier-dependent glycosyltransferase [Desulfobacterales bacterium]|nr:phospholipid carrier-dependent glycosyltransferase [Desulfobacterales bacterium]
MTFEDIKKQMITNFRFEYLIAGTLLVLIVSVLLMAAVPPVSRDALTHHLAVPKLYLKSGGMTEIPTVVFSYYPMNLDLLYLIPLYFENDIIPKYIHFAFALLTAWLIFIFLKERTTRVSYGLLGALMFLSLPVIIKLSITVYVDLGLVFFTTAALFYIMKWAANGFQIRYLGIAGLFCGLALGTKYNGLISFFLLTCFIPILYIRTQLNNGAPKEDLAANGLRQKNTAIFISLRSIQAAAIFIMVSLLVFSPWMIRNLRWTGNPIYPLYQKVFHAIQLADHEPDPAAAPSVNTNVIAGDGDLGHFALRKRALNETFLEMVTTPVRIFFQGQDDNPKFFDGRLNPYLFLFPFLAFVGFKGLAYRQKRENFVLIGFSVLFLLYTFLQIDMRIRYIAPIIPPLVILSVIGLYQTICTIQKKCPVGRYRMGVVLLAVAVVGLLSLNGQYLIKQFGYVKAIPYLTGQIGRDDYITRYREEYPAIQFINQQLPPTTKLLALYLGNRIYYSDREMVCDDNFFKRAIATATSANALADTLQSHDFSHLLIRADLFKMFTFNYLTADQRQMFNTFLATRTRKLFSADVYHVLEITDLH